MREQFQTAIDLIDAGDVKGLRDLLSQHPDLATARDDGNATLLIRLIDWPGHRPKAAESARTLLTAGADVEARRDDENGTALGGALCTEETDVIEVLVEYGADIRAACGWQDGTLLELADNLCENWERHDDEKIQRIASVFSRAAGRAVPQRAAMGNTTPIVFVKDVEASVRFFTKQLGFRKEWEVDSDSACGKYVSVDRGGANFHITGCACEDQRHIGNLSTRVSAGPVDALYKEFQAAGVTIKKELGDRAWGLREFEIEDPDGNWFIFWNFSPD